MVESSALIRFLGRSFVLADDIQGLGVSRHIRGINELTLINSRESFRGHNPGPGKWKNPDAKENDEVDHGLHKHAPASCPPMHITMRRLPSAQCACEPSAIEFAMDQPARMERVNFEERYIVQVEALTMFTTARENLPLPSPKYLKIHTTCCRVAHTSGVAAYYHNADDHDVLVAQAGSRNPVESDPLAAL